MLVTVAVISILLVAVVPAFNIIAGSGGLTGATNNVAGLLEQARAEAMAARSYVYVGFVNTTNADGNAELRCGAVISIDGSSNTAPTNLRPVSKLVKLPGILMTNYTALPQIVKDSSDSSLQSDADYIVNFAATTYLKDKFNDSSFNSCPTFGISPQGEVLPTSGAVVFFRTTTALGLAPTHGITATTRDGAIVSYSGGTGQVRVTKPQ